MDVVEELREVATNALKGWEEELKDSEILSKSTFQDKDSFKTIIMYKRPDGEIMQITLIEKIKDMRC